MLKRKIFFVLLCSMVCICSLHARQDSTGAEHPARDTTKTDSTTFARHSVYLELLGNGLSGSYNYDIRILEFLSLKVGYGPLVMINLLSGSTNHLVELGVGYGYGAPLHIGIGGGGSLPPFSYYTFVFGYRYQRRSGGFFFKAGITPSIGERSTIPFGISLGYTF